MAILRAGILGGVKNKVGGVVGYNSRGLDIIRSYAVPTNPNTTAQQIQRALFSQIVRVLSACWKDDIKRYWDIIQSGKTVTGWSRAVKVNLGLQSSEGFDYELFQPVVGPLEIMENLSADYVPGGVTKVEVFLGGGMPYVPGLTPIGAALVYDKARNVAYLDFLTDLEQQTLSISLVGTPQPEDLAVYAWSSDDLRTRTSPAAYVPLNV